MHWVDAGVGSLSHAKKQTGGIIATKARARRFRSIGFSVVEYRGRNAAYQNAQGDGERSERGMDEMSALHLDASTLTTQPRPTYGQSMKIRSCFVSVGCLAILSLSQIGCSDTDGGTETQEPPGVAYPQASGHCVDVINQYRATMGLTPYERWTDAEICSDGEAKSDSETMTAHGAFGQCGESAQNECPGWSGAPEKMIDGCLDMMWAEGPGDFNGHGHYINMSSTDYKMASCGFHVTADGSVWAVQNFK